MIVMLIYYLNLSFRKFTTFIRDTQPFMDKNINPFKNAQMKG